MHAGVGELGVRRVGLGGEVDQARNDDGGHAVLEDVDLLGQGRVLGQDLAEEVVDGAGHAMAVRLATDDHDVAFHQRPDEADVLLGQDLAVEAGEHLRPQDRIVLGQRVAALDLALGLRATHVRVEHAGLLDDADQRVPVGAEDAVRVPDRQRVLASFFQLLHVVEDLLREPAVVAGAEPGSHDRVRLPFARLHVVDGDHRNHRRGVVPLLVDPEGGEEDLIGEVSVHRHRRLGDAMAVAVDELREAPRVVDGTSTAPAPHVEGAFGEAEVLVPVDAQEMDLQLVGARCFHAVLALPLGRHVQQLLVVGPVVPFGRVVGVEEGGEGELLDLHVVPFKSFLRHD